MTSTAKRLTAFWPVTALLIVASVLYCLPLFSGLDHWGRQDWDQFTFRYSTPRLALLRDHVWPTWNPYADGGTVLLAHPNSPVLSPWYSLVLAFGAPVGLRLQVVLFMALGAIGMAAFVMRLGASRAGAVVAGIVFMMSAHFALHVAEGHLEWCVLGLMPWLALCVLRLQDSVRYVVLAALLLASVLMFGAVYIPAVFLPFFSVWILLTAVRTRQWQPILRWGAVVALAASLSSVKLLPAMAFATDSHREVMPDQRTRPRVLLTALFNPRQALLYQAYRDRKLPDGHFAKTVAGAEAASVMKKLNGLRVDLGFHEYGGYIGLAGILLAGLGGFHTLGRLWPLYGAGALAGVVVLGASSPVDLWSALRHLPFYGQLQVPARFGAGVVFALAVAAAFGMDAVIGRLHGSLNRWRPVAAFLLASALFGELAFMGRSLFSDVFIVPRAKLEAHNDFAQRFKERFAPALGESLHVGVMTSVMFPHTLTNSGTLDAYENLTASRGEVRATGDPDYRGEAYLEYGRGSVSIRTWTMSRVTLRVAADRPDYLVLNQNFYDGWRARRRDAQGHVDEIRAFSAARGLISVPVHREHTEVELFYVPDRLVAGAWISIATLLFCLAALWFSARASSKWPRTRRDSPPGREQ